MDDHAARTEWGWKPQFDLQQMTAHMLTQLAAKLSTTL
jgi:nucleoside-diphosphate-sugar epimerase